MMNHGRCRLVLLQWPNHIQFHMNPRASIPNHIVRSFLFCNSLYFVVLSIVHWHDQIYKPRKSRNLPNIALLLPLCLWAEQAACRWRQADTGLSFWSFSSAPTQSKCISFGPSPSRSLRSRRLHTSKRLLWKRFVMQSLVCRVQGWL